MKVWAWGKLAHNYCTSTPVVLTAPNDISHLAIGRQYSTACTFTGDLYIWGSRFYSDDGCIPPLKILDSPILQVKSSLTTDSHILVIVDGGVLLNCSISKQNSFNQVNIQKLALDVKIAKIACGESHFLMLDEQGRVYAWGDGARGKLGLGQVLKAAAPVMISSLAGVNVTDIACGFSHCLALAESEGKSVVYSWGSGADGRLGLETTDDQYEPAQISYLTRYSVVKIACGYLHSCVLTQQGELISFGFNGYGQLGIGNVERATMPSVCFNLASEKVVSIGCGAFHTVVCMENGNLISMGLGNKGQLGNRQFTIQRMPTNVCLKTSELVTEGAVVIVCGPDNSFLLTNLEYKVTNVMDTSYAATTESSNTESILDFRISASFRPLNLPPKSAEETALHKKLVEENTKAYLENIKKKEQAQRDLKKRQLEREASIRDMMKLWDYEILPNWDTMKNTRQVEKLIKRGIPPKMRGEVWLRQAGNPLSITPEYFAINLQKARTRDLSADSPHFGKQNSAKLINMDISRTFNQMGYFKEGSPLNTQLRDLLEAFVQCRPDIGYVQGMSYVGGILLLNMEPFRAFLMLMNIVGYPTLLPFYRLDDGGIQRRCQLYKVLLKHNLPDLCDHMDYQGVQHKVVLIEWFITLFSRALNQEVVSRVWDCFFLHGIPILFRAGVAILKILSDQLINLEFDEMMKVLSTTNERILDGDVMVKGIYSIDLPNWIENEIAKLSGDDM